MEIEAYRKLKDQCEALEAQKQIYQTRLRDAALKYNDEQIISDAENFRDEVLGNRVKVQNLVEKCNQMSQALEQYSAENRVLRKMVGVPDDYQFELGDIIQEGQMQVEKYRAQVRALEEEVEELEEERARLRRRLREN
jgi:chromosome segregation ATPase